MIDGTHIIIKGDAMSAKDIVDNAKMNSAGAMELMQDVINHLDSENKFDKLKAATMIRVICHFFADELHPESKSIYSSILESIMENKLAWGYDEA